MTNSIKTYPRAKAIRKRCLGCASSASLVKECQFKDDCQLWPYRLKSTGLPRGKTSQQRRRDIASYCLDFCCCGSFNEVKKCPSIWCPLWPYRFATKNVPIPEYDQSELAKIKNQ